MLSMILFYHSVAICHRFERVLSAAQAAKVIVKKLKPEDLKLLEATLNSSAEGVMSEIILFWKS